MDNISPLFQIKLIDEIESRLWETFEKSKYKKVENYLDRWREVIDYEGSGFNQWEVYDFYIV